MATIELGKQRVIDACEAALQHQRKLNHDTYNVYYEEGLKKKTFWTRRLYTVEEAESYATSMMHDDYHSMWYSYAVYDIDQILKTAMCANETIVLKSEEVRCIEQFLVM